MQNVKNLFYERTEDENEVRITWSTAPTVILYGAIAVFILLSALSRQYPDYAALLINCSKVLLLVLLVFSVVYFATTRRVNAESREAMRRGNIKIEGGRLSFRSPFTCIIPKIKPEEERWSEETEEPAGAEETEAPEEAEEPLKAEETEENNG